MRPLYIFPTDYTRSYFANRFPWLCVTWGTLIGAYSDRVVVVQPTDMHGAEINLRFQRVLSDARARVRPGGRLMIVSAYGLPLACERNF